MRHCVLTYTVLFSTTIRPTYTYAFIPNWILVYHFTPRKIAFIGSAAKSYLRNINIENMNPIDLE